MWSMANLKLGNKPDQTELLIWAATTEELQNQSGHAMEFPGGYKGVADKLGAGLTWYRFKTVRPGERSGMAYDGLVYVNGRWAFFPKPWKAVR